MSTRRHSNVVNRDELEPIEMRHGKFHMSSLGLARNAGSQQLGGSLYELAPGERTFPFHYHCANEEAVFVISGTGTVRIGDAQVAVRAGDWIAHPVGPEHPHQMINDGDAPLVYLCVSTMHKCEVVGYPDSKKVAMRAGPSFENPWIRQSHRAGESLGYYDDEPDAK